MVAGSSKKIYQQFSIIVRISTHRAYYMRVDIEARYVVTKQSTLNATAIMKIYLIRSNQICAI